MTELFVDTWGWLELADRKAPRHRMVRGFFESKTVGRFVTTDYVLDETITRLFQRRHFSSGRKFVEGMLAMVRTGHLRLERITPSRFDQAWGLRLRYRDKPGISFTDLTSCAVMREIKLSKILTEDRDFARVNLGFQILP